MEINGEHNRRLNQYAEFIAGPDPVIKIQFLDGRRFLAVLNKEVCLFFIKFKNRK